jgi:predicted DNA binding CopG/RHH family protein
MNKKLEIPEGGIFAIGKNNLVNSDSKASNIDNSVSTNGNSKGNSFKISKKNFKENRTQVGWRINVSTVEKIQELAYLSRMNVNEFVQELLDKVLAELDIE